MGHHKSTVWFGPKGALTALKRVYFVKRSLYIYSVRNILSYPMWDITNTPPLMQTQRPHYVPWDCGAKQTNTPYGVKQTPTPVLGIGSDTICNDPLSTM